MGFRVVIKEVRVMKNRVITCLAAVAMSVFAGCINARWQGGTTTPRTSQSALPCRYCIEDIEFNAGMGVDAQLQQWPWSDYAKDPESFRRGVMEARPDVFSSDPSAERISLSCRVTANSFDETFGPFIITLGFIFPEISLRQTECQIFVVRNGIRSNCSANLKSKDEIWMGYPWTVHSCLSSPERDEGLAETVTWNHNTYNAKQGEINAAKYRAFASAVQRAIENSLPR